MLYVVRYVLEGNRLTLQHDAVSVMEIAAQACFPNFIL